MKNYIPFIVLVTLFACQNKPTEIAKIPLSIADSIKACESRNVPPPIVLEGSYDDDSFCILFYFLHRKTDFFPYNFGYFPLRFFLLRHSCLKAKQTCTRFSIVLLQFAPV